jgi:6-phosphogluconate dehydrogenase
MSKDIAQLIVLAIAAVIVLLFCWWIKRRSDAYNRELAEQAAEDDRLFREMLANKAIDRANAKAAGVSTEDFAVKVGNALGQVANGVVVEATKFLDQKAEEEKKSH